MPDMSKTNVAVVTGSNKGIGFAIVKGLLANNYPGVVYLTSRDETNGEKAIDELRKLGYNPEYHQLDINDERSIDNLACDLQNKHGGIDLLINNAAIKYNSQSTEAYHIQIEKTIETNYYGTKRVCYYLFPILRQNAQVINISSAAGHICAIPNNDLNLKAQFTKNITTDQLNNILQDFIMSSKNSQLIRNWKHAGYVISKVAICALTIAQQRTFDNECEEANISVNCVHPGYVDTDMTSHKGVQTPDEGAKSALFLALNKQHGFKGQFIWYDCQCVDWLSNTMPKDLKQ